jgi:hypothetical protein
MLVQAGVEVDYGKDPSAWWEVVGSCKQIASPPHTVCSHLLTGDVVSITVESRYGGGVDFFEITDRTDLNRCNFIQAEPASLPLSDGGTAECVAEAHTLPMEQFDTIYFDSCDPGTDTTQSGIGNWDHYYTWVKYNNNCDNASPGDISFDGTTFPVRWHAC